MGFKCGIVGLPNVGKSTLFNALTKTSAAQAANFPFCTIEPNTGDVAVPDIRLEQLSQLVGSKQTIPTRITFVDIAGLVRGASKGEGLGNQFLANIREMDAIAHVLRCFEDDDITHVENRIDPLADLETITTELMLADLESVEKRLVGLRKRANAGDKDAKAHVNVLDKILEVLQDGKPARSANLDADESKLAQGLGLLTTKPVLYVCNVSEDDAVSGNTMTQQVIDFASTENIPVVIISAAIEAEIAQLDEEERNEFLSEMGLENPGLDRMIRAGYELLDLITYFTVGPKEARAWTIQKGTKAPQAAGVIHTDFEKGFIRAETTNCKDYLELGGETQAKEAGKTRLEGKEYIVQDGDIMLFRFNT
ncbi:MAG: redox-regulated ATPase YchF [Alphaproteobacteria bacterium]